MIPDLESYGGASTLPAVFSHRRSTQTHDIRNETSLELQRAARKAQDAVDADKRSRCGRAGPRRGARRSRAEADQPRRCARRLSPARRPERDVAAHHLRRRSSSTAHRRPHPVAAISPGAPLVPGRSSPLTCRLLDGRRDSLHSRRTPRPAALSARCTCCAPCATLQTKQRRRDRRKFRQRHAAERGTFQSATPHGMGCNGASTLRAGSPNGGYDR